MKRILGGFLVSIIMLAGLALGYYALFLPRQQPPSAERIAITPELVARGRYLAEDVLQCIDCHSERDWTLYGGPPKPPIGAGRACMNRDTPTAGVNVGQQHFPGVLCIRNITPDVETGIGGWTDGEIMRAIREGVDRRGRGLFPIMPYFVYRDLADDDLRAVVAYMRSLPPVRSVRPEKRIEFPMNMLVHLWPKPVNAPVTKPDPADPVAYGEYLSKVARCEFCHTPRKTNSMEGFPGRRLAGGMPFFLGPRVMYTMNLTPDPTGLGPWTKADFIGLFRKRAVPEPVPPEANTLMNWSAFAQMTDADLGALYDFFRTLPPVPTQREPI